MEYKFNIKPIELTDIRLHGDKKYNSNNHGNKPEDYLHVLSQSYTEKWIDLFKPVYTKIIINNPEHIKLIKLGNNVGKITGKIPRIFMQDMEQLFDEFKHYFDGTNYFVKVNNVSLKYGKHGIGPYNNIQNIIESSVTCIEGHSPIYPDVKQIDIYLIPWVNIEPINEFRVFVYNNKITAISQQNLYSVLYDEESIKKIPENLNIIVDYFYKEIVTKINWISNYTYDFAIVDNKPYFIEMNCFGKEYAAGSALFHWLLDEKILYNSFENGDNKIEFRYTI
jgi:hypothetical protein